MLEHASASFKITTDRAIANEIVRHRLASYAQESTRWINYNNSDMEFIGQHFLYSGDEKIWEEKHTKTGDDL